MNLIVINIKEIKHYDPLYYKLKWFKPIIIILKFHNPKRKKKNYKKKELASGSQ